MGLNLDELAKLRKGLFSSGADELIKKHVFKLKGKKTLRIVPYQFDNQKFGIPVSFHKKKGKGFQWFVSPACYNMPDPFIEAASLLKEKGNKFDADLAKTLYPENKFMFPVIIRGEEHLGVKIWEVPYGVHKFLFDSLFEKNSETGEYEYGDITDIMSGTDIIAEYNDNANPKYSIKLARKPSALTNDKTFLNTILNNQVRIEELYPAESYDKLKQVLATYLQLNTPADPKEVMPQMNQNVSQQTNQSFVQPVQQQVQNVVPLQVQAPPFANTPTNMDDTMAEFAKYFNPNK